MAIPVRGGWGIEALTSDKKASELPRKGAAAQSKNRDMGSALRSVYQKTVEEAVPDDLMSLLGKLD
ncbi:NepR family anti-sigma factor [Sphingomonas sp. MMS24-JH45]